MNDSKLKARKFRVCSVVALLLLAAMLVLGGSGANLALNGGQAGVKQGTPQLSFSPFVTRAEASVLDHFTLTGTFPASIKAGVPFATPANDITVTAYDSGNAVITDYVGSVWFTSTDGAATLVDGIGSPYTFVLGDFGVHTFLGTDFTLETIGSWTITVTDGSVFADSPSITVVPYRFTFATIIGPETAGVPFSITITAEDASTAVAAGYVGTNTLTSSVGTINPTSAGPFVGGVWTGLVTLDTPGASVWIVTSGSGASGTSGTFAVIPAPTASITVTSNPLMGAGSITIGAVPTVTNPQSYTWNPGDTHNFVAVSPVSCGVGCRYVFASWTSTSIGTVSTAAFTYTVPITDETVTANYVTEYYLTVNSAYDTPGGSGWYVGGATAHATLASGTVAGAPGTQRVFTGWSGDASGTGLTSGGITMSAAKTAVANWQTQYYLTMLVTPPGNGLLIPSSGWYDEFTSVVIYVAPVNGWTFQQWSGTGTGHYSGPDIIAYIVMDGPITETANMVPWPGPGVTMTVKYTIVGGGSPTAPVISYVEGGVNQQYTLTTTAHNIQADVGTTWSVAPNPLTGSSSSVRWYSNQPLSGFPSAGTYEFIFQHQYYLTMQVNPISAGSTSPVSSWWNAGAAVPISAVGNIGYTFHDWAGSGAGSNTGTTNSVSISMNAPITEIADFTGPPPPTSVTMVVSYVIVGGDTGASAPVFNYVLSSADHQYTLTTTPTNIQVDMGSTWLVAPNPLIGSSPSERWFSSQTLTDTAAAGTYVFSFQHQYYLTMQVNPASSGTTTPVSSWQNAGATVNLSASAASSYSFSAWTGTGTGHYSGTNNPATATMNSPIVEVAGFTPITPPPPSPSPCIIATAAYGSPMNPEVAYMRYVRDNMIGSTPTGSMLRNSWNWFYYLWSPPIAGVISTSPALQALFRVLLLPLVGIIHATGWTFTVLGSGNFAAVMAFTAAAIMSTAVYVMAPVLTVRMLWKKRYIKHA